VSALRKVVGSDAITTISGQGYRFMLPVTKGGIELNRISTPKHYSVGVSLSDPVSRSRPRYSSSFRVSVRMNNTHGNHKRSISGGAQRGVISVVHWSPRRVIRA
jgi:hypothetical protein